MNRFVLSLLLALALAAPAMAQSALTWTTDPAGAGDTKTGLRQGERAYMYSLFAADTMPVPLNTKECQNGVLLRLNPDVDGALITCSVEVYSCDDDTVLEANHATACSPYKFSDDGLGDSTHVMIGHATTDTTIRRVYTPALAVDFSNATPDQCQLEAWCLPR